MQECLINSSSLKTAEAKLIWFSCGLLMNKFMRSVKKILFTHFNKKRNKNCSFRIPVLHTICAILINVF